MPSNPRVEPSLEQIHGQILQRWPAAVRISTPELKRRFPDRSNLTAAWRVSDIIAESPNDLILAVDSDFPWSLPFISLPEPVNGISYPHIEGDGYICTVPSSAVYELPVSLPHFEALVADAEMVLAHGRAQENDNDFYAEAHSYWSLVVPQSGTVLLLHRPPTGHDIWWAAACGANIITGPTAASLADWAKKSTQKISSAEPTLVLRLSAPLHPSDYPLTPRDLIQLVEDNGAGELLRSAVVRWRYRAPLRVLICFEHSGKSVYLGAELPAPRTVYMPGAKEPGVPGFRPASKSATARLRALRQIPSRFGHWRAIPIYREFLLERTSGESAKPLACCHVVIAGCGALGGQLAVHLAQAGIGKLTLLDSDVLDWRNVGRHVLDGTFVGCNKATALKDAILRRFPDADVDAHAKSWEGYFRTAPDVLDGADLIVSTTAEPASNLHLDSLAKDLRIAPVIFAWMEPFAACAHAVFRYPNGAGLSEITDSCGLLLEPVVDRESMPPLPQEPSCGAFYQPYSAISALCAVSVVAELVVDALTGRATASTLRTWVGTPPSFQDNRLSITPVWHSRINKNGFSRRYDQPILARDPR
jgi:molybdopterin/thiamine biosynthesis adenylyltransferase